MMMVMRRIQIVMMISVPVMHPPRASLGGDHGGVGGGGSAGSLRRELFESEAGVCQVSSPPPPLPLITAPPIPPHPHSSPTPWGHTAQGRLGWSGGGASPLRTSGA